MAHWGRYGFPQMRECHHMQAKTHAVRVVHDHWTMPSSHGPKAMMKSRVSQRGRSDQQWHDLLTPLSVPPAHVCIPQNSRTVCTLLLPGKAMSISVPVLLYENGDTFYKPWNSFRMPASRHRIGSSAVCISDKHSRAAWEPMMEVEVVVVHP